MSYRLYEDIENTSYWPEENICDTSIPLKKIKSGLLFRIHQGFLQICLEKSKQTIHFTEVCSQTTCTWKCVRAFVISEIQMEATSSSRDPTALHSSSEPLEPVQAGSWPVEWQRWRGWLPPGLESLGSEPSSSPKLQHPADTDSGK